MTDTVVQTSFTIPVDQPDPADYEWRAFTDDGERHAFPPRTDGFPKPAICLVRWSVRAGHHGQAWCQDCLRGLREQIVAMGRALADVDLTESEQRLLDGNR